MAIYADCDECQAKQSREIRAEMRCGFLALRDGIGKAWEHPSYKGESPTTCIGYTSKLPETIEIIRARRHWLNGSLTTYCGGEPEEMVLALVEIFDGAVQEIEQLIMTPGSKGGLGDD